MTSNCYYTRITQNNIDKLTKFIEFLDSEVLSKTSTLGNLRFAPSNLTSEIVLGKYLVLYQNSCQRCMPMLSLWAKDPEETFQNHTYLDTSKLLSNILREVTRIYDSVSAGEQTIIDKLRQHINNITNNTSSNEDQLQRKETPGCNGNERVGTPVRYSGNKLTVAIGYLSNKARTSQV